MSSSDGSHYGVEAVSRSLRHFLLGKAFAVISATVILFLLARELEPAAYAAYVALQALVVLIGRVGGFGVQKVLLRYLPELRATGNNRGAFRLLWQATLLRLALIGLVTLAAAAFVPALARTFSLTEWLWLIPWYLGVGYVRLTNHWLAAMLECFLWQREAQYPVALASLAKLAAFLALAGSLDLQTVVAIELAGEALMLVLLLAGWAVRWRGEPARREGTTTWWRENRGRALRFGFWGFLQNQSGLLYGSSPNRLVAASLLPAPEVALFGLADNLINLVRRFMPTQLFIGLIRPVAVAHFSERGDFTRVAWITHLAYRLNLSILVLGIALMVTVGEPLLDWLTGGRYGAAALLVAGLLVVTAAEGMRGMTEVMAQAVERNQTLFVSNLIQSASLLIALPLVAVIGLWGLVAANLVGTVLANLTVIVRLRRDGHGFRIDLASVAAIAAYAAAAALLGWGLMDAGVHFLAAGAAVVALYALLYLWRPPLAADEREMILRLLRRRRGRQPGQARRRVPGKERGEGGTDGGTLAMTPAPADGAADPARGGSPRA